MQVRTCGGACIARKSDAVASADPLTDFYILLGEMSVDRLLVLVVLNANEFPIPAIALIADFDDHAPLRGGDIPVRERRIDEACPEIDAVMPSHSVSRIHVRVLSETLRDVDFIDRIFHTLIDFFLLSRRRENYCILSDEFVDISNDNNNRRFGGRNCESESEDISPRLICEVGDGNKGGDVRLDKRRDVLLDKFEVEHRNLILDELYHTWKSSQTTSRNDARQMTIPGPLDHLHRLREEPRGMHKQRGQVETQETKECGCDIDCDTVLHIGYL